MFIIELYAGALIGICFAFIVILLCKKNLGDEYSVETLFEKRLRSETIIEGLKWEKRLKNKVKKSIEKAVLAYLEDNGFSTEIESVEIVSVDIKAESRYFYHVIFHCCTDEDYAAGEIGAKFTGGFDVIKFKTVNRENREVVHDHEQVNF